MFFSAFNLLEASLPSLVSRLAPSHLRGAALGAYATSQLLGAGVGGVMGGVMMLHVSLPAVFAAAASLTLLWLPLLLWGRLRVVAANAVAHV